MSDESIDSDSPLTVESQRAFSEDQTVLGDIIEIPYSMENLKLAYDNLPVQLRSEISIEDLKPTHYYVRFHPKTEAELDTLRGLSHILY